MVTGEGKTGLSKKKTYKVYEQDVNLLEGIGEAELTDEKIKLAEVFICKLYNQVPDTSGPDQVS
jgi:hypothetical protein